MHDKPDFGIEFLKHIFLNSAINVPNFGDFPVKAKSSPIRKLLFLFLRVIEKLNYRSKVILVSRSGALMSTLKINDFVRYQYLFYRLSDQVSKDKYMKTLAFQMLGSHMVDLNFGEKYFAEVTNLRELIIDHDKSKSKFLEYKYDLTNIGYDELKLWNNTYGIYFTFVMEQYAYDNKCNVEKGDVVLDVGGCYGDTALYFASKVGPEGMVYAFEFVPSNIKVMKENFKLNPDLMNRIKIINQPATNISNNLIHYSDSGPSTKVEEKAFINSSSVATVTIDEVVERDNLSSVDFIKMDIEGSELVALMGAEFTIKKFKPKLAICVYHKLEDFYEIPSYIDSLGVDYDFYFDYYTPVGWEMVLYCVPK